MPRTQAADRVVTSLIRSVSLSQAVENRPLRVFGDALVIGSVFAIGAAIYWFAVGYVVGREGFPLDDAFIHLQFARNLFRHGEMAFNTGTPSSGCTAPGFAALVALARYAFDNWLHASFAVTTIASAGTILLVYGILRRWTGDADVARWGGIVLALASPMIIQAFSGMEAAVYSVFCLLAIAIYGSGGLGRRLAGAVVLALCIWFRPEFLVGCPLLALEWAWRRHRRTGGAQEATIVELLAMGLIWVGMIAAYAGFHYALDGHFVPTTFGAKAVAHFALRPHWLEGLPAIMRHGNWEYLPLALIVLPILNLLLMGVGVFTVCAPLAFGLEASAKQLWRIESAAGAGWRLAVLLLFGYPLARAFVEPAGTLWYQGQRYFAHLTPLFVLIVFGAWPLTRSLVAGSRWNWTRRPLKTQARRAVIWAAGASVLTGAIAVFSVKNINEMQVATAQWLKAHSSKDDVVAANDIGAVGFYSGRRILDTVGLVEPAITEHFLNGGDLASYLVRRRPRYVVLFPEWYPDFTSIRGGLTRCAAFSASPNFVCGGPELVVYEPHWRVLEAMCASRGGPGVTRGSGTLGHAQTLP